MHFINIPEHRYTSIRLTFKRIKPTSDYIRILKLCEDSPKTLREIYPNVSSQPLAGEVVALAKQGYLAKYTTAKHIKYHGDTYNTYTKVWYGITGKGKMLISMACDI